jgi:hypothetical protein
MSTGDGIFLSSILIGLVMLYGQTKDRWNWSKVVKITGVVIFSLSIIIYHWLNDWNAFKYDWTIRGFFSGILSFFAIMFISIAPFLVANYVYREILDKSFEFDDEGNERTIFKVFSWIFFINICLIAIFFGDTLKIYSYMIVDSFAK